uniref:Uncharacterized protein n=1 Tax=Rhizophora mucronata TaxID=61149 RepID=A0A2P2PPP5_RHIMU
MVPAMPMLFNFVSLGDQSLLDLSNKCSPAKCLTLLGLVSFIF